MQETSSIPGLGRSPGGADASILAQEIPWTAKSVGLQSMELLSRTPLSNRARGIEKTAIKKKKKKSWKEPELINLKVDWNPFRNRAPLSTRRVLIVILIDGGDAICVKLG